MNKNRIKIGCIGITAIFAFCIILAIVVQIGIETGILPDTKATKTAEAVAKNETATIIALTPTDTPTPTNTPTITFTPSNTPTATITPTPSDTPLSTNTPTITNTPQPPSGLTMLETNIYEVAGVHAIRLSDIRKLNDVVTAYFEIDTQEGYNNEATAQALYAQVYAVAIATYGSGNFRQFIFGVILWDGGNPATDWTFDNESDTWKQTVLSTTPEATLPSPVGQDSESILETRYINTTANNVNIRNGAGTTYEVIGQLPHGTKISVTGEDDDWYRIEYENGVGWVYASLTSTNRPSTNTSSGSGGGSVPTTAPSAVCNCSSNSLNCGDFDFQVDAQVCFDYCMATVGSDIHRFDQDNDQVACETLP